MTPAQSARRAAGFALEEAEFVDAMPRAEVERHAQAFAAMPDTLLVSLARQLKTVARQAAR